jgi:hypothetical protein
MDRETDKHNPRLDDAMAQEVDSLLRGAPVESRTQEGRLQEDPAVGPGRRFDVDGQAGLGIDDTAADRRAELARHLAAVRFPAGRDRLVAAAEADHAPEDLVQALRALPEDEEYVNLQAVWMAIGGEAEGPHTR